MITHGNTTIQTLKLRNFLSVGDAEYKFGRINTIRGANGAGKSTILDAIRFALGGGDEATLLRRGESEGAVGLVLSDGTSVTRKLGAKSNRLAVADANGHGIPSPATHLKSKFDGFALDPIEFVKAKTAEQTSLYLASAPLYASRERLAGIADGLSAADTSRHAVALFAELIDAQKSARYYYSKTVREKTAHVQQLAQTLPAGNSADDLAAELSQLEAERVRIEAKRTIRREEYRAAADERRAGLQQSYERKLAELNAWRTAEAASIERTHAESVEAMMQKSGESLAPVAAKITALTEHIRSAEVHRQTAEIIRFNNVEIETARRNEAECNRIIAELEQYRTELFASLPIEGVTIEDGEIHVGGVPVSRLSTAEVMRFAVRVATVRIGDIAAVLVDNGECFDDANFAGLVAECETQNVQLFVAVVDDVELSVTTD